MTESKQEITPTPSANQLPKNLRLSSNPKEDLATIEKYIGTQEKLFLYTQKLIGSNIIVYRQPGGGRYAVDPESEEQKYLESHPDQFFWGDPYFVVVYFDYSKDMWDPSTDFYVGDIELSVLRNSSDVEFHVREQKDLGCDNDLKCAQSKFNHSQKDRKEIETLFANKKPGDWLIRRGSDPKALVISIKGQDGSTVHYQFLPTKSGKWRKEPDKKVIEYDSIQDVFEKLGLLLKNSTFFK